MKIHTGIRCLFVFVIALGNCCDATAIDYAEQIEPIFAEHCYKCHGEKKGLGKLRLHTAEAIEASVAKHADLLGDGTPEKSELFERLVLPADHKKRMPKGGDPLPQAEIDLIRQWITEGAVYTAASAASTPSTEKAEPEQPEQPLPLPEVSAASEDKVQQLTEAGAQVGTLSAGSNLLTVSFALSSDPTGDEQLALLPAVAEQVYSLNLAGSEATDRGWENLSKLNNLTKLHLEKSSITDGGLAAIAGLVRLDYLNLYGTSVTDAGLKHLENLKHLKGLYLWQTKVSFEAARALEEKIPGLQVNLGHDHPEVARRRLAKEIETTKQQLEASKNDYAEAEARLQGATEAKEAAEKRLAELEKQQKSLEGDSEPVEPAEPSEN